MFNASSTSPSDDLLKSDRVRPPHADSFVQFTEIVRYHSLVDLKSDWERLDCRSARRLVIVLLLPAEFRVDLPGLIRRRHPASRLFIASVTGRWPGLISPGDLALHSSALGWQEISCHRTPSAAISAGLQSQNLEERSVLFSPEDSERLGDQAGSPTASSLEHG